MGRDVRRKMREYPTNESRVSSEWTGGEEDRQQLIRAPSVPNTVETNASGGKDVRV